MVGSDNSDFNLNKLDKGWTFKQRNYYAYESKVKSNNMKCHLEQNKIMQPPEPNPPVPFISLKVKPCAKKDGFLRSGYKRNVKRMQS